MTAVPAGLLAVSEGNCCFLIYVRVEFFENILGSSKNNSSKEAVQLKPQPLPTQTGLGGCFPTGQAGATGLQPARQDLHCQHWAPPRASPLPCGFGSPASDPSPEVGGSDWLSLGAHLGPSSQVSWEGANLAFYTPWGGGGTSSASHQASSQQTGLLKCQPTTEEGPPTLLTVRDVHRDLPASLRCDSHTNCVKSGATTFALLIPPAVLYHIKAKEAQSWGGTQKEPSSTERKRRCGKAE